MRVAFEKAAAGDQARKGREDHEPLISHEGEVKRIILAPITRELKANERSLRAEAQPGKYKYRRRTHPLWRKLLGAGEVRAVKHDAVYTEHTRR